MVTELFYRVESDAHNILNNFLKLRTAEHDTELIYYQKTINIRRRDDIYNSVVFFNQLDDFKVYKLTVESVDLLEGETKEITFLIKDNLQRKAIFVTSIKFGQVNEIIFSTKSNAYNLELKFYSGEIKKADNISVRLNNIKLEVIGSNEWYEEHLKFVDRTNFAYLGKTLAQKYCTENASTFYIIVNQHIGDTVRYIRLLKAFKEYYSPSSSLYHYEAEKELFIFKKRKNIKKIIVITNSIIAAVARLYSECIDSIIELSPKELDYLELYASSGTTKFNNIIPDEDINYRIVGKHNIERTETKAYLYGIGDLLWNLCIPKDSSWAEMHISEITSKNTDILIERLDIDCDNTFIICPNAQSSSLLNETIWNSLITELVAMGKHVLINAPSGEDIFHGATPLSCPVDVLCDLAKRGCVVIGVQSGLMDVIAEFKAFKKLVVLCVIKTESDRHFAKNRGAIKDINIYGNKIYIRLEQFDDDYVITQVNKVIC